MGSLQGWKNLIIGGELPLNRSCRGEPKAHRHPADRRHGAIQNLSLVPPAPYSTRQNCCGGRG